MRRSILIGSVLGLIALKLWLVSGLPIFAIAFAKPDEQLFVRLAQFIINGQWLGPYDELTLAKGAGYPLWVAANFYLGLPLTISQQLLYAAGCWLLVQSVRPLLKHNWAALLLFAVLLWNPMTYEMPVLGRVLRQNLYTPLSLMLLAGSLGLFVRAADRHVRLWGWAVLGGLSFGGFWLTREEGLWIAPTLLLLAAVTAWKAWRGGAVRRLFLPAVIAVTCAATPIVAVCALNASHYGWFGTVEFRAPEFLHAYGALSRVRSPQTLPLVPVMREARLRLYAVSPAFAELQPFLEGEIGQMAARASSPYIGRPPEENEMAGGWFMWALREAVVKAGHGTDARSALQFYDRLAREIDAACADGRVEALPPRATMRPLWRPGYAKGLWERFVRFADYAASFGHFATGPTKSYGRPDQIQLFRDITRSRLAPWADGPDELLPQQARLDETKRQILHFTGKRLRRVFFAFALLGLASWVFLCVRSIRRPQPMDLWVINTAVAGAFVTSVTIVALIDLTSFPAQNPGYFSHVYPLVIFFGFTTCYAAAIEVIAVLRRGAGNSIARTAN